MEKVFNKSHRIIIVSILLFAVLGLSSNVYAKEKKVTGITLNYITVTMNPGTTLKLNATVKPSKATNKTITWKSNNSNIAEVSSDGTIKAKSGGKTQITATSNSNKSVVATCNVTVNKNVEVVGFTIDTKSKTIYEGQKFTIKGTIIPDNAKNKSIIWKSSDPKIATVDRRSCYSKKSR